MEQKFSISNQTIDTLRACKNAEFYGIFKGMIFVAVIFLLGLAVYYSVDSLRRIASAQETIADNSSSKHIPVTQD